jgi:BirA family biotin operon repressor/biotin-[acetyl-CoA-carboxylase] ligase
LIEAADLVATGQSLILKWPNDLMLGTAKLAGILLERSGDRVVAGFGVNLETAPEIEARETAALNVPLLPQAFAPLLAGSFARMLDLWRNTEAEAFARAWLARAHPIGSRLKVHSAPGKSLEGTFDGIERDGALRLRVDDAVKIIRVGDVEF